MKKVFYLLFAILFIPFISQATTTPLDDVISWMHSNALTQYTNTIAFWANRQIRRDEAAKLFSQFAKNILKIKTTVTSSVCTALTDVASTNTMRNYVLNACNKWYLQWSNGKFYPKASLSNAQAIATIIRMLEWTQDESWASWSDAYYTRADALWLLSGLNLTNKSTPITRGILALLLYRAGQVGTGDDAIGSTGSALTQPDFVIQWLARDPAYSGPKVDDEHLYLAASIKNIWATVQLSDSTKLGITCTSNDATIVNYVITWGNFAQNGSQIFHMSNQINTGIYLFPSADSWYKLTCNLQLYSFDVTESNVNNNSKNLVFAVGE